MNTNNPNTGGGWPDPDGPTTVTPKFNRPGPPPQQPPTPAAGWGQQPPTPAAGWEQQPAPTPPGTPHSSWGTPGTTTPQQPQPWAATPPPPTQAPAAGWAAPGQQPGWPPATPGTPTPPARGKRRKLIIAAAAAAVLFIAAIVVVPKITDSVGGKSLTPGETVTAYLEALAAGDAEKALSYGKATPANTDFLTNEVLGKQIAKMPITNIRILDGSEGPGMEALGMTSVRVAADFGGTTSDATLQMSRVDDQWKLDNAFTSVQIQESVSDNAAADTATLFGTSLKGASTVYLFPGFTDLASSNKNLSIKSQNLLLKELQSGRSYLAMNFELSKSGSAGVSDAVTGAFAACEASKSLNPPGCPYSITRPDAVEGSATWGRADISGVTASFFSERDLTVRVAGPVVMTVDIVLRDGSTAHGKIDKFFTGTVDVSKTPATLSF